jgi:hypothetical protein
MELSMTIALLSGLAIGQFFTALVIAFFVFFAELLEGYTVGGGRRAIEQLINALPRHVTVRPNGQESELRAEELSAGEIIDGRLLEDRLCAVANRYSLHQIIFPVLLAPMLDRRSQNRKRGLCGVDHLPIRTRNERTGTLQQDLGKRQTRTAQAKALC